MKRKAKGFTFIELAITMAIAAVVLTLALPSFATMVKNRRLAYQINDFTATLNLARSEAVKRRIPVTVCKSNDDGTACVLTGDLAQGRIVFVDDKSTVGTVENGELILKVYTAMHSSLSFSGAAGPAGSNIAHFISYNANGTTQDGGNVKLCDDRTGTFGKNVSVNAMGRNRTTSGIGCS